MFNPHCYVKILNSSLLHLNEYVEIRTVNPETAYVVDGAKMRYPVEFINSAVIAVDRKMLRSKSAIWLLYIHLCNPVQGAYLIQQQYERGATPMDE